MSTFRPNDEIHFKDDESTEALLPFNTTEKDDGLTQHKSKPWLSLSSLIILILVVVNTGLACANIQATHSNALRTLAVIPAQDVMQLSKPDQYYGLGEASRKKLLHPELYAGASG
ncbi:unnamed protein product [Peniophora sp. CBMAI 1063]|nr:unnamed protein product [Peniophora sp. CBMAI 1063]